MGRSARLKRPGIAWNTLIHCVGDDGVVSCMASMMVGNTCPFPEGLGRACDRTLSGLLRIWAVRRFSTVTVSVRDRTPRDGGRTQNIQRAVNPLRHPLHGVRESMRVLT